MTLVVQRATTRNHNICDESGLKPLDRIMPLDVFHNVQTRHYLAEWSYQTKPLSITL
jgi:hypothetical protein